MNPPLSASLTLVSAVFLVNVTYAQGGLRTLQATIRPEFLAHDETQLKADIAYVHKEFVDDWRSTQAWDRILAPTLRAVDLIPIVGVIGLGHALEQRQTKLFDEELANWTTYGLEKLQRQGRLAGATVSDIANVLLDKSGPFANEPGPVREAIRDFVLKLNAKDATDLRNQIAALQNRMESDRKLTGQQLLDLRKGLEEVHAKVSELNSKLVEAAKQSKPTDAQKALGVLSAVQANADALGTIFPKDKQLVSLSAHVSRAAQFGQMAILASGSAVYALPAVASGISFVRGFGGDQESAQQVLIDLIKALEDLMRRHHLAEMVALERNYGQILRNTALLKSIAFQEINQCMDVLQSKLGRSEYSPEGFYDVALGPAFRTMPAVKSSFQAPSQKLEACQDGMKTRFTSIGDFGPFLFDPKEPVPTKDLAPDQQEATRNFVNEALIPTISDVGRVFGPRMFTGLQSAASHDVAALRGKQARLAKLDIAASVVPQSVLAPINPGIAARYAGFVVALHNTFELAPKGRFTGAFGDWNDGSTTVKAAAELARLTAIQQRLMTGDVVLPVLEKIVRIESLARVEDRAAFTELVQSGFLVANFPLSNSKQDAEAFGKIREDILLAVSSNVILRSNLLIWDLNEELRDPPAKASLGAALKSGAGALLPKRWLQTWRLRWLPPKDSKSIGKWQYSFQYAKKNKLGKIEITRVEAELPTVDDILTGRFTGTPGLDYVEAVERASAKELASYAFVEYAGKPDLYNRVVRLVKSGIDPLAGLDSTAQR